MRIDVESMSNFILKPSMKPQECSAFICMKSGLKILSITQSVNFKLSVKTEMLKTV